MGFSFLHVMERLLVEQERQACAQELVSMAFVMHGMLEVQEQMEFKLNMLGAGKGTIWEGFVEWEGPEHASKEEWWVWTPGTGESRYGSGSQVLSGGLM